MPIICMWWCGEDSKGPEGDEDSPGEESICELPFRITLEPCGLCAGGSIWGDEPAMCWPAPGAADAGVIA